MQLSILSTSDIHGHIRADDFRRPLLNDSLGLSRAASVIADYQQQAKLAASTIQTNITLPKKGAIIDVKPNNSNATNGVL